MTIVGRSSVWGMSGWIAATWVLLVLVPTASAVSHNPSVLFAHEVGVVQWIVALACVGLGALLGCTAIVSLGRRWVWRRNPSRVEPWVAAVLVAVPVWSVADRLVGGGNAALAAAVAIAGAAGVGLAAARVGRAGVVLFSIALLTAVLGSAAILAPVATAGGSTPDLHPGAAPNRTNVLWVILDEAGAAGLTTPDGSIRDEFPHLRWLQERSTTYAQAYTTYPYTDIAIPAMMSGRTSVDDLTRESAFTLMYDEGFLPQLADHFEMLVPQRDFFCRSYACWTGDVSLGDRIEVLAGDSAAIVASAALPAPIRALFPSTDGRVRDFWADAPDAATTDLGPFLDHWQATAQPDRPFFAVVHSYAAHYPWNVDADGRTVMPLSADPFGVGSRFAECEGSHVPCTPGLVELRRLQYANGLRDADRELGRQLAGLASRGLLDSTLVVVTADHGASVALGQDSRRPGPVADRVDVARVPLIVKLPGQTRPAVVPDARSTGQIMPTVLAETGLVADADLVGLDRPAPDGSSYAHPSPGSAVGAVDGTDPIADLAAVPLAAWPSRDYEGAPPLPDDLVSAATTFWPGWPTVEAAIRVADGTSDVAAVLVVTRDRRCAPGDGVTGVILSDRGPIAVVEWESEVGPSGARRGWALAAGARGAALAVRCGLAGPSVAGASPVQG